MINLIKKYQKNFKNITKYYNYLVEKTKQHKYVDITNEWLIDNYYILAEHNNLIKNINKKIKNNYKTIKNNYALLSNIVEKNNYNISFNILTTELKTYQKENKKVFSYKELKYLLPTLTLIYCEKINSICEDERKKITNKETIEKIINEKKEPTLNDFLIQNIDIKNNTHYIYEINNQIGHVDDSNELFKELNEYLKNNELILKDIVNEEIKDKISNNEIISNVFTNLTDFLEYSEEDIYEKISKTEKKLLTDQVYKEMTTNSKALYRRKLIKQAFKHHMNEYDYLNEIYNSKEHIGFKLFKNKNYKLKFIIYFLVIAILTFMSCYYLSNVFINNRIIGFIILLIPVSQLIIQIINEIIIEVVPPSYIPKLDFSKGIPDYAKTMVVIPTIISSEEKIKKMFDNLESFYLINKTDNLYFTLLGDVKQEKEKLMDYDKNISKFGKEYAEKLNKKYNKEIFYFIYRKRLWNKHENSYLGYERKRGALVQFNKILLNENVDETKYFNVNMLHNKKLDIKYVITLDADTKLVLNSALNLVGAMAHPLNKPILNNEGTKVIQGYGLMQPRVGVDIESTNRSLYSQLYAGIGGFDTYSAIVPNVYQDSFNEGSFVGKGIYDLEIFNKLLSNTFPDNLILSHDLLEGNYLRCGYISDIELIDEFPSKFLVDVTRHHRWARGDTQIIGWLKSKVKNKNKQKVKNPLNLLEKYKILDNIIRMFLNPMLLIVLLLAFTCKENKTYIWIGLVVLEIALSVLLFIKSKMSFKPKNLKKIYYNKLLFGGKSILLRSYLSFATIPYYTKLYMDAFFRTLYRLIYSHNNLLNWTTAEDVEKTAKNSLKIYLKDFYFNYIIGLVFIAIGLFTSNIAAYIISLIFFSAPLFLYNVSKDIKDNREVLKEKQIKDLKKIAHDTWKYFEDGLTEENNYLIPDNYQENREQKLDSRTSPTAIGYSLTSIVSAYELGFIDKEKAVFLLKNISRSINDLEKWYGHLYNWYDIKTKKVLNPLFVSTVDSGNLVACYIVAREFLIKIEEDDLAKQYEKLINNTNFKKLYTKKDVFSIGYDEIEGKLSDYNYNKFASESRLTSFIAICLGEVSYKHWFALDKSLTTYKNHKGLISWSGTAFEYYMPLLFMKNYPNTLLDESYNFAHLCQKSYIQHVSHKLPWGISESAYNELDNSLNYKYKAFSVPYLKAKEEQINRIVLSPYSSIMALDLYPEDVYENISKFINLGMYSKYGLYEAYDYDNKGIVKSYFAHHQGMSLLGLTNYLKKDVIRELFHSNIYIKSFEILLKEKVQIQSNIDLKMADYKKYNYEKEKIENDIRAFNYISYLPEMSVLSNEKYSLIMNDRGNSFSRYRTQQLNRYRKVTEQDYGIFLLIRDTKTNYIWSNTYAPLNIKPDKYEVVFAADKIKFLRRDTSISTKTEIVVCKTHHAEIRKISFKNESDVDKELELTSYTEPILSENMDDISHKVFNNMFIKTEFDKSTNSLIAKRKNRNASNVNSYMFMRLISSNFEDDYSYETERSNFIGRGENISNAKAIYNNLTNYSGDNLDPILSIRNKIVVPASSSVSVYLLVGFGRSREQVNDIINKYSDKQQLNREFKISTLMNVINTKHLNITGEEMRTYNVMLNYIYQTTRISVNEERMDILRNNALGQSGLWKFGVSGDRPIISVEINDISKMHFVLEVLKAFEYFKSKSIFVDVIIINNEEGQSQKLIKKQIDDEIYRIYTLNSFYHTPGSITVINKEMITNEDNSLLNTVPRVKFVAEEFSSLKDAIEDMKDKNMISDYPKYLEEKNIEMENTEKLSFDNSYGGFKNNGREYVIYNKNTPAPWSNIIANKNFGTIITNNGCGYTYAYNSGEFKITSWTNEMIVNDQSEGFKFNNEKFIPEKCTHGFGYSILESETKDLYHQVTEFVSLNDNVKIYLMKIKNKQQKSSKVNIDFWINPVFGNFEEKTSRHILAEFMGDDNYLKMRNVYSINYGDINVFMSSSEKIKEAICEKILVKSISFDLDLSKDEEKEIVFVLGCSLSDSQNIELIKKYTNIKNAEQELSKVKEHWHNTLNTIEIKSPDKSFDYMMNGWYLYQTLSSRIMAKAGFYQVSGAFGYRDQLQDAMNIAIVNPLYTKMQIINNAGHQFEEGDVLHWWHEKNHFGLRSRYKDDFLWLVYATAYYLKITEDYSILDEQIPYVSGDELSDYETEKGIVFSYTEKTESLFEHCIKSLELSMNSLGSHNLPLMGGGDWNDGMNKVGIKGKGESVWLGFFLYNTIDNFLDEIKKTKHTIDFDKYEKFIDNLKDSLNKEAWDGNYYLRAFYDNGDKLGSSENTECKIDLISQSFSILSGVASKERTQKAITSVEEFLVDDKAKIIKLLTPPFEKTLNNPGYIMNYPKGIRENGGQYTHSVSWYLMALIKAGYHDRAYRYFQMINPINRTKAENKTDIYKDEPYVIAADIYSSNSFYARGGWTWYTGSSGWFYKVGIEDILGFHKHGNKLTLKPKIPIAWDDFKLKYKYMDTTYVIEVSKGPKESLSLDGATKSGNTINLKNDKKEHKVVLIIR